MAIYQLGDQVPIIPASCYIAPEATIIGSVTLGTLPPGVWHELGREERASLYHGRFPGV